MAAAKKFMFATDFSGNSRKAVDEEALEAARADAFRNGLDQARRESDQQLGALLSQLLRHGERLLAHQAALKGARGLRAGRSGFG